MAARNVLIGENYVVKVADFGLARDVYRDDKYIKVSPVSQLKFILFRRASNPFEKKLLLSDAALLVNSLEKNLSHYEREIANLFPGSSLFLAPDATLGTELEESNPRSEKAFERDKQTQTAQQCARNF